MPIGPGVPRDKRDRWGRLLVTRRSYRGPDGTTIGELELRVVTFPAREFGQRRLGAVRRDDRYGQPSAVMDLGEAVQTAVERGLPLLLSTEAAGHLTDTVRVGRMKDARARSRSPPRTGCQRRRGEGRRAGDRRAAHAQTGGVRVTLDAGARQLVRMTLARPLEDDPVLLGRQQEVAALRWSDPASTPPRPAAATRSPRVGRSRTLRHNPAAASDDRRRGPAARTVARRADARRARPRLPPLAPNVAVVVVDDRRPVAAQIRQFDRTLADRAGVTLVANGTLDRYAADLQVIAWHVLFADEALRYANPATDAHQALRSCCGSGRSLTAGC